MRGSVLAAEWRHLSDARLCDLARDGDTEASAELYRRYVRAARNVARHIVGHRGEVDDIVSDAFAGVLRAFRNGHGPTDEFRRYLLACVRNVCKQRRPLPVPVPDDDLERPALEDPERYAEADTVARAFASLHPRWQETLWMTAVEHRPAGEVGRRMHLSPNAAAALSSRARKAFATAYLAEHQSVATAPACTRTWPRLAGYVRDALGAADRAEIDRHLAQCTVCTRAVDELRDVNASLRSLQMPAAAAALASTVGRNSASTLALPVGAGLISKWAAAALIAVPTFAAGVAIVEQHERPVRLEPVVRRIDPLQPMLTQPTPAAGTKTPAPTPAATDGSIAPLPGAPTVTTILAPPDVPLSPVTSVAGVPVPGVTVPPVTLPPLTVPQLTVPELTLPPVTLPPVTLPPVTVPPVTLPPITVPPITVVVTVPPLGL